jgi:hypothetical protein
MSIYFNGYPPINTSIIAVKKISKAVERFEGKIRKTTTNMGTHNGNIALLKLFRSISIFER